MDKKPDLVVDALGLYCPEPILLLTDEMEGLETGKILELVLDDPSGEEDVKSWCKRTGHTLLSISKDGDEFHFLILKK
ncbi:MAG: sulfurtransferase TusA family protein [Candidatus Thermoplasmatota archaeon]|nr:sulfurtransferase TusA family protein [Candidatus Thermoplasmatota archaeon]